MKTHESIRVKALFQISWLMLVFLLLSSAANALQHRTDFVILYLIAIVASVIHLYLLYRYRRIDQASEGLMTILFLVFFSFFLIGEQSSFDVLWVLILPAVANIVGSLRRTQVWIMRFVVLLAAMVLLKSFCSDCLPYEGFALWSLLWAGIFLSGMTLYHKQVQTSLESEIEHYQATLETRIAKAVSEITALNEALELTQSEIIERLGTLGEFRSKETGMHVRRVGMYTKTLALLHGLPRADAELLEKAAPLHDIGKVGIEDSILHKPAKLTPEEFERMKCHTLIGESILGNSDKPLLRLAAEIAGGHHEKYDGSGYPRGLKGTAIPISARLTAIADVFDALCSRRSYKEAWDYAKVKAYFSNERGTHFDPVLVDLLLANFETFLAIFDSNKDSGTPKEIPCENI